MASVNSVTIIGHLGRDPEIRHMPSGDAVASLAVATTDTWKDKTTGEKISQTEWHRISFFGRMAEVCGQYLKKGSLVYVEGSLRTRKYTDKDGVEKYATEIRGDMMQMLGGDRDKESTSAAPVREPARSQGSKTTQQASDYQRARDGEARQQRPAPNFSDMDDDLSEVPF